MYYKGLFFAGSTLALTLLAGCSSVANATTVDLEVGYFCKDCSYQEAVEFAKQKAVPNVSCRISSTPTEDYVENCYSQPKLFFVLNETSRRLNGFIVKHNNQGMARHELVVVAEERSLSRDHSNLILEALDAKQLLNRNLAKAASDFFYEINPSTRSTASGLSLSNVGALMPLAETDPKANCANDPHSQALSDALNPFYADGLTRRLKDYIQQGIRSGEYQSQEEALSKFHFGIQGLNVSASASQRNGTEIAISASWGLNEKSSTYFDHEYISAFDTSSSSLRWLASVEGGEIRLGLSQYNSFISGLSVANLLSGDRKYKISRCVAKALGDAFPDSTVVNTNEFADTNDWFGPYPIIGNTWGASAESDRGWICEYSFNKRTGANITSFSFLGRCP